MDVETGIIIEMILRSNHPEHISENLDFQLDESYDHPEFIRVWIIPNDPNEERTPVFINRCLYSLARTMNLNPQGIIPW